MFNSSDKNPCAVVGLIIGCSIAGAAISVFCALISLPGEVESKDFEAACAAGFSMFGCRYPDEYAPVREGVAYIPCPQIAYSVPLCDNNQTALAHAYAQNNHSFQIDPLFFLVAAVAGAAFGALSGFLTTAKSICSGSTDSTNSTNIIKNDNVKVVMLSDMAPV